MAKQERVIICLSGGLEPDKKTPKPWVIPRLDKTAELFHRGGYRGIITTSRGTFRDPNLDGHTFTDLKRYPVTEAEASRRYLLARGIPAEVVFAEDQSMDTIGNAFFARRDFLEPNSWTKPTVVTSEFHMPKAQCVFDWVLGSGFEPTFVAVEDVGLSWADYWRRSQWESRMVLFYNDTFETYSATLKRDVRGDMKFFDWYIHQINPAYGAPPDSNHQLLNLTAQFIHSDLLSIPSPPPDAPYNVSG